jgi:glutamyl-Q tRNA(Asp) synthetase
LGHAYSAILAHDLARKNGGEFLLRIEDIDQSRARPAWEQQIYDDLTWLGLEWPDPVMVQSQRQPSYDAALDQLWAAGLLFPCTCNRKDILAAANAPQEGAPLIGPDGIIYPGTCREQTQDFSGPRPKDVALRLDVDACHCEAFGYQEISNGAPQTLSSDLADIIETVGAIVLARKDMGTSYHLSVVLDDAAQGITHVVRGEDLSEATKIHVLLQKLLNLPTPTYFHHPLVRDDMGKRLAKRDDARAISKYRDDGYSPDDIRKMVGLTR